MSLQEKHKQLKEKLLKIDAEDEIAYVDQVLGMMMKILSYLQQTT